MLLLKLAVVQPWHTLRKISYASRSVAPPHGNGVKHSSAKAEESRKDVIIFSPKELQEDPGVYSITIVSSASVESDYTLDIQQHKTSLAAQLHEGDTAALKKVRFTSAVRTHSSIEADGGMTGPTCIQSLRVQRNSLQDCHLRVSRRTTPSNFRRTSHPRLHLFMNRMQLLSRRVRLNVQQKPHKSTDLVLEEGWA